MTILGLRVARPRVLLVLALLGVAGALAATALADDKGDKGIGEVGVTSAGTATRPVPLTPEERETALRVMAAETKALGLDGSYTAEIRGEYGVFEEQGMRLVAATLAFDPPVTSSGRWTTLICDKTRLSESHMLVSGFTRLEVTVDLKSQSAIEVVPDASDPAARLALEKQASSIVEFRVLDPRTHAELLPARSARGDGTDVDPSTICPRGTWGR